MSVIVRSILLLSASNVFMTFAFFYMKQRLTLDYLWAGLCIVGACYFMFRGGASGH